MKNLPVKSLTTLALSAPLFLRSASAQSLEAKLLRENATVTIHVADKKTQLGIPGAVVVMKDNQNSYQDTTDSQGNVTFNDVYTSVDSDEAVPESHVLSQNYPNPFNPGTTIEFGLKRAVDVDIYIVNILGQRIKHLVDEALMPGSYKAEWDGTDYNEKPVSAGMYLAVMRTGDGFVKSIKMIKEDGSAFGNNGFSRIGSFREKGSIDKERGRLYTIEIKKQNYIPLNANEMIKGDTTLVYQLTPGKEFRAVIIDNQTLKNKKGIVEVNGEQYLTDDNGFVNIYLDPEVEKIDSVRAWSLSDTASSFIATYRELQLDSSWTIPAGLMITTYDSLTDVEEKLRVSPELFRAFMEEGNMYEASAPAHGLRSIDFQHAQNPVPNQEGEHGYVYWIDRDYLHRRSPNNFGTLSREEQEYIKDVIEREIISHIREPMHKPQIYLAQPGEKPPREYNPETGGTRFASGLIIVTHMRGGNGYGFSWSDYDKDGTIDAALATVGDPTNLDSKIIEEAGSIIVLNAINSTEMYGKTAFSEGGATGYLTPADLKVLAIEENVNKDVQWQLFKLPNGLYVMRGYYKPLTRIDDILRIPNNSQ